MNTIMMIIEVTVPLAVGFAFGAMWGLSRHTELPGRIQERTILRTTRRWMNAMQSLGYKQEDIDAVMERMSNKIMPSYVPAPPPVKDSQLDKKPSLCEKLKDLRVAVEWRWPTVPKEDGDILMQLCIDYAQRIHAAARVGSFDLLEVDLQNEWMKRSKQEYAGMHPTVRIAVDDYKEGFVQVLFDARQVEGRKYV